MIKKTFAQQKSVVITLAIASLLSCPAGAEQWKILGTRPMGMGGAFVAMAQGPMAQYWNPAGLAMTSIETVSGIEIPITAGIEMTGEIMKNASAIGDMASKLKGITDAQKDGKAADADQMAAFVKTLTLLDDMNGQGKGAMVEVAGGVNLKFSKVAVSVNNFTTIGMNPFVDVTNIGLGASTGGEQGVQFGTVTAGTLSDGSYTDARDTIKQAINTIGYDNLIALMGNPTANGAAINNATELANALVNTAKQQGMSVTNVTTAANTLNQYAADAKPIIAAAATSTNSYNNNQSNLMVDAASFVEIAFGYGRFVKFLEGLSIGGNLKMINGCIGRDEFKFIEESQTQDAFKDTNSITKSSWSPSIDMGFLWDVNKRYPKLKMSPKIGLVIRNITSPSFDRPNAAGGTYKLDRQARLGFALKPAGFWNLLMDIDVTKNKTAVNEFDSRQFAIGTEINIVNRKGFNIPLRLGMCKNLAESSSKMAYTLGMGVNMCYMHLDLAGAISSDRTTLYDKDVPVRALVSAVCGILF
ncbi:MAG: hypothetical protein QME49_01165 [bacterium]|nr:hypothetical protein [bacterium]